MKNHRLHAIGAVICVTALLVLVGCPNASHLRELVEQRVLGDLEGARPTVAVTSSEGGHTRNSPFTITISFSEPVSGFGLDDVTITNATAGTLVTTDN